MSAFDRPTIVPCLFVALSIGLNLVSGALASTTAPEYDPDLYLHGGTTGLGKAATDTFYLYGGPDDPTAYGDPDGLDGKFESANFAPRMNGWVGVDRTAEKGPPLPFAGDFSKVLVHFQDIDPCARNRSPMVGFLDDGTPPSNGGGQSTGGSLSSNWSYGVDGGWVVNYTGGLSGGAVGLFNEVWSPEIDFDLPGPDDDDAGVVILGFDVWAHLPVENCIYYTWRVRSFDGAQWSDWASNESIGYSSPTPKFQRVERNVSHLIPDITTVEKMQIALGVRDAKDICGIGQSDATPSPLFDNVSLRKVAAAGPLFSLRISELFQDSFSQSGAAASEYDGPTGPNDESQFAVRVDIARALPGTGPNIVAGDSLTLDIVPGVPGTTLDGMPVLKYRLYANPAFDHVRDTSMHSSSPGTFDPELAYEGTWTIWEGSVDGTQPVMSSGVSKVATGRYTFDLPFDGSPRATIPEPPEAKGFYPGDWLFYYIEATDSAGNTTTIPSGPGGGAPPTNWTTSWYGLTGLSSHRYDRAFRVHALPTIESSGGHARLLFINDALGFGNRVLWEHFWRFSMGAGPHFDDYVVMAPAMGLSNGIGSAGAHGATADQLEGYNCIVYDSGPRSSLLLSNGSSQPGETDRSDDLGVLQAWHVQPADRFAVYFGDNLASHLDRHSPTYLQSTLGTQLGASSSDVSGEIGNQSSPTVGPTGAGTSASVFGATWLASGGCPDLNTFDHLEPFSGSSAVAGHEYLTPQGVGGAYTPAASIWHDRSASGFRKIDLTIPVGFQAIRSSTSTPHARATLLWHALNVAGHAPFGSIDVSTGTPGGKIALRPNFPNPFNPTTRIAFSLSDPGQARLRLYDLRGRMVRALIDGPLDAGKHEVTLDGRDDRGVELATGVYVYELVVEGRRVAKKMALVK